LVRGTKSFGCLYNGYAGIKGCFFLLLYRYFFFMLSIIPLLFIGSVSCIPIFSTNIFKIGCSKPIHQDLDLDQGLRPDIQNNANFGKWCFIDK
jgi:hypothetical protein